MDLSAIQHPASTANVPLNELAGDKHLTTKQKVGEVARQFEALLLQQILASTEKPVIKSEFTDNSPEAGIYRSMIVRQLSEAISKSGSFGLAKMLQHQLTPQLQADAAQSGGADAKPSEASVPTSAAPAPASVPSPSPTTLPSEPFIGRAAATFTQP